MSAKDDQLDMNRLSVQSTAIASSATKSAELAQSIGINDVDEGVLVI